MILKKGKIWHIQNDNTAYSDEELITMIKSGKLKADTRITNRDLKKWIRIKDSIYQFYLPKL